MFSCPFCGPRAETEFRYGAEAGKIRPTPSRAASAEAWSNYLYVQRNPKGDTREIWVHATCGEFFLMERDTLTHEVRGSSSIRKGAEP